MSATMTSLSVPSQPKHGTSVSNSKLISDSKTEHSSFPHQQRSSKQTHRTSHLISFPFPLPSHSHVENTISFVLIFSSSCIFSYHQLSWTSFHYITSLLKPSFFSLRMYLVISCTKCVVSKFRSTLICSPLLSCSDCSVLARRFPWGTGCMPKQSQ